MEIEELARRDKQDHIIEAIWAELSTIPLNTHQEITQDFRSPGQDWYYPRGTKKTFIWHDIDLAHSQGVFSIIEKRIKEWEEQATTRKASHR